jgi:hypothetical protein
MNPKEEEISNEELTNTIMAEMGDEAIQEAYQMFIIIQQADSLELTLINKVFGDIVHRSDDDRIGRVTLVRVGKILTVLKKAFPKDLTSESIIEKALVFLALTAKFSLEEQAILVAIAKKYT